MNKHPKQKQTETRRQERTVCVSFSAVKTHEHKAVKEKQTLLPSTLWVPLPVLWLRQHHLATIWRKRAVTWAISAIYKLQASSDGHFTLNFKVSTTITYSFLRIPFPTYWIIHPLHLLVLIRTSIQWKENTEKSPRFWLKRNQLLLPKLQKLCSHFH